MDAFVQQLCDLAPEVDVDLGNFFDDECVATRRAVVNVFSAPAVSCLATKADALNRHMRFGDDLHEPPVFAKPSDEAPCDVGLPCASQVNLSGAAIFPQGRVLRCPPPRWPAARAGLRDAWLLWASARS